LKRQFSEEKITNKYIKLYSKYLSIIVIQIKTTLRFYLTPVRLAIIKNTKMLVRMQKIKNPHTLSVGM
jgi:hypothetical protein